MARMVFSEVVGTMSFLRPQCDDDSVDRLHYYYTTTFLLVVAVLISLKMFGGSPIECWLPAEFRPSWQEYTELICWSMSTYFVPSAFISPSSPLPNGSREPIGGVKDRQQQSQQPKQNNSQNVLIAYYQWTPFFLVFSALLFYSPCVVWRKLSAKSGLVLNEIVGFAKSAVEQCPTGAMMYQPNFHGRTAKLRGIAAHLSSAFRHRFRTKSTAAGYANKKATKSDELEGLSHSHQCCYLSSLYMAIKLLFLGIVLLQAILMNKFLQTDKYDFYGLGVLQDLIQGKEWKDSGNFPRLTFCDVDVRVLGTVQKYTVQCVLVINIFTEKVFVLLWFWYSLLMLITIVNGLGWLLAILPFSSRKEFIVRRLQLADIHFDADKFAECEQQIDRFVREFLRLDGSFVLRMLDLHTGEWVCAEIVDMIWEEFRRNDKKSHQQQKHQQQQKPMTRQHSFEEKGQQQPSKEPLHLQPQLPPSAAEHDGNEEDKMPPIGTRRRRSKVGLLAPLMARPMEELPSAAWASLPNLLWAGGNANIGHPAFSGFGGMPSSSHQQAFPFRPTPKPTVDDSTESEAPHGSRHSHANRPMSSLNATARRKKFRMNSSSTSFDQSASPSTCHGRLLRRKRLERSATFSTLPLAPSPLALHSVTALRKNSDIREEEEEEEEDLMEGEEEK